MSKLSTQPPVNSTVMACDSIGVTQVTTARERRAASSAALNEAGMALSNGGAQPRRRNLAAQLHSGAVQSGGTQQPSKLKKPTQTRAYTYAAAATVEPRHVNKL